jgi:Mg2+ and Co2+ transporter CorA
MQTIITYNENEVTELKNLQNIKPEDKVWIDLVDPTDDVVQNFVTHFHLDQSAVELFYKQVQEASDQTSGRPHIYYTIGYKVQGFTNCYHGGCVLILW